MEVHYAAMPLPRWICGGFLPSAGDGALLQQCAQACRRPPFCQVKGRFACSAHRRRLPTIFAFIPARSHGSLRFAESKSPQFAPCQQIPISPQNNFSAVVSAKSSKLGASPVHASLGNGHTGAAVTGLQSICQLLRLALNERLAACLCLHYASQQLPLEVFRLGPP